MRVLNPHCSLNDDIDIAIAFSHPHWPRPLYNQTPKTHITIKSITHGHANVSGVDKHTDTPTMDSFVRGDVGVQ